ncbi:tautomerase family protein [Ideonella sp. DXS29W]|uniref:Tautomerase family protein n=1 Tax=Ideonella lacteola TaxID=2984193 RepID=A0ABU9BXG9_9BURK
MPFISVTTWPTLGDEKSQALIEALTHTVREVTGAPMDKIIVVINEIPRNRWGEGGVLGSNPGFPELSRRRDPA